MKLTLDDVIKIDNIVMTLKAENFNEGYKTRLFYEEVVRRFNSK